jgi:tRNA-uridine 2-sulfurtransferase
MYVIDIRAADRAVVIGTRGELLGNGLIAREMNWLVDRPVVGDRVEVQIRHRSAPASAEIVRIDDDEIELALQQPVSAIAPGQSAVIYDGDRVLGGGIIESSKRARAGLPVLAA